MAVVVDKENGVSLQQGSGRHFVMPRVISRDQVHALGIAVEFWRGRQVLEPLGCRVDFAPGLHDSLHCLTTSEGSSRASEIAVAIASLIESNARIKGFCFPSARVYSCT